MLFNSHFFVKRSIKRFVDCGCIITIDPSKSKLELVTLKGKKKNIGKSILQGVLNQVYIICLYILVEIITFHLINEALIRNSQFVLPILDLN